MPGGTRTRVVGAAILDSASAPTRVLAAQRAYPESLRGLWEFPGGKQEPGETPRDALVRECREELGVDLALLDEVEAADPEGWPLSGTAVMRVFTAVLSSGSQGEPSTDPGPALEARVRAGDDHLAARWLPLADPGAVLALPWIPADLPIVAALLELLRTE
ncbi:(deoxy)nucleoside triphosphate pyrophosphohydrolase [Kocuria tytonis]|uniref:8-oxo-dGTP diphosphatase n=1 Tax=Kocuria tytonis TaxID=2054280 RepID=A0A495A1H2_9MICC|nr:NUDIX domain-containing protein [Kocuria tytonis]RKQ33320.1 NUDIX domain-containing protein [Kocuria tytonis]